MPSASADPLPPESAQSTTWQLTWSDEFNGAAGAAPDSGKWVFDTGADNGWGNQELQYYTDSRANSELTGDGKLSIKARRNTDSSKWCPYTLSGTAGTCSFTSARLKTMGKFSQKYGRFEARIKVPKGAGVWPAFWAMGNDGAWPNRGEIDVMEHAGSAPGTASSAIHSGDQPNGHHLDWESFTLPGGQQFGDGYHVFAADWFPDHISFSIDGEIYFTTWKESIIHTRGDGWYFDQPFYLLLNLAIDSGAFGGGANAATWTSPSDPAELLVDYVRVFQAVPPAVAVSGPIIGLNDVCADSAAGLNTDGNQLQMYTCNGTAAQHFTIGTDGTVRVLGKCMTANGGGTANGTLVQLYTCDGTAKQQWRIESNGVLVNPVSGRCLDAAGSSSANGTPLQLWDCNTSAGQFWKFPSLPSGAWALNDGSGTAANDRVSGQTGTLTSGVSWLTDGTRGTVGSFNGTNGTVTPNKAVVNTAGSFTTSAWVKHNGGTGNHTVVGQDGTTISSFFLQYNNVTTAGPTWAFSMPSTDAANPGWNVVYSPITTTGVWTHLAGVYDAAAKTMKLYVNGTLAGTVTNVTGWASTGTLTIGRGKYAGNPADHFPGLISDVRTYSHPLTQAQIQSSMN